MLLGCSPHRSHWWRGWKERRERNIKDQSCSPLWRFCPSCLLVASILSNTIDQYVSKWLYVKSLFHLWPLVAQKAVFDSPPESSVCPIYRWLYQISFFGVFSWSSHGETTFFRSDIWSTETCFCGLETVASWLRQHVVYVFGVRLSLVHPRMVKHFCKLLSPFSNLWSAQGWICWGNVPSCPRSSSKDEWPKKNAGVDKWGVTSPPASQYLLSCIINLSNWSASPPRPKKNQSQSLDFWSNRQSFWIGFLSAIRNHIEAVHGKLPKVIRFCSHQRPGQMDSQVRQTWGSDWCSLCSPGARSASSHELHHLLWSAVCHLAALEPHLSREQSFLSD